MFLGTRIQGLMEARRPAAAGVEPEESLCHDFLIRRELATVSKNGNYKRDVGQNVVTWRIGL